MMKLAQFGGCQPREYNRYHPIGIIRFRNLFPPRFIIARELLYVPKHCDVRGQHYCFPGHEGAVKNVSRMVQETISQAWCIYRHPISPNWCVFGAAVVMT